MGVGDKAATIAVVGVTLGLGFGGGLLIKEVSSGNIPKEDVFWCAELFKPVSFCI